MNNLNAKDENDKTIKHELRNKLCFKTKPDANGNYKWEFHKPWGNFTKNTEDELNKTIISFKQNTRVINKTVNNYQVWKEEDGVMKKVTVKQIKGDNWAIRKPLHAETVSGKVSLKRIKQSHITISNAIEQIELIVDKEVKKQLKEKVKQYPDNVEGLKKHLKAFPVMIDGKAIDKIQIYETIHATAKRKRNNLDVSFDEKKIQKITDTGIQKILLNHLKQEIYQNKIDENGKKIAPQEVAFSEIGIDELNKNIKVLNNGKNHKSIKKVRVFEESKRFQLGQIGNRVDKYVETAQGTNLYFAVYQKKDGKRDYKTVPLNEVIEGQKMGAQEKIKPNECSVPQKLFDFKNQQDFSLLFFLNPNDLVFIPTHEEINDPNLVDFNNLTKVQINRIYKTEKTSGKECYFIQNNIANLIYQYDAKLKFGEFGSQNKLQISIEVSKISESCWKLEVDRLGKIKNVIR